MKKLFIIFFLLFSFTSAAYAEGEDKSTNEQENTEQTTNEESVEQTSDSSGIKISPAIIQIETPVVQGSKDFLTNFKVTNESLEKQIIEVKQEGHLKPKEEVIELEPGEEKEVSVSFDIPENKQPGEVTDTLLFKATSTQNETLNYRVEATYNVVKPESSFQLPVSLDKILIGLVGFVLVILLMIVIKNKKPKNNKLYQLYEPKRKK